jgi:hypothetical protein
MKITQRLPLSLADATIPADWQGDNKKDEKVTETRNTAEKGQKKPPESVCFQGVL